MSRQYAAASRQAASSAGELAALAENMTDSIDAFRVADDDEQSDDTSWTGPTAVHPWTDEVDAEADADDDAHTDLEGAAEPDEAGDEVDEVDEADEAVEEPAGQPA